MKDIEKTIMQAYNEGETRREIATGLGLQTKDITKFIRLAKDSYCDIFVDADGLWNNASEVLATEALEVFGRRVNRLELFANCLRSVSDTARKLSMSVRTPDKPSSCVHKNNADIALSIRVAELAEAGRLMQTVVLFASDSDFYPLMVRLRERGYTVVLAHNVISQGFLSGCQELGVMCFDLRAAMRGKAELALDTMLAWANARFNIGNSIGGLFAKLHDKGICSDAKSKLGAFLEQSFNEALSFSSDWEHFTISREARKRFITAWENEFGSKAVFADLASTSRLAELKEYAEGLQQPPTAIYVISDTRQKGITSA